LTSGCQSPRPTGRATAEPSRSPVHRSAAPGVCSSASTTAEGGIHAQHAEIRTHRRHRVRPATGRNELQVTVHQLTGRLITARARLNQTQIAKSHPELQSAQPPSPWQAATSIKDHRHIYSSVLMHDHRSTVAPDDNQCSAIPIGRTRMTTVTVGWLVAAGVPEQCPPKQCRPSSATGWTTRVLGPWGVRAGPQGPAFSFTSGYVTLPDPDTPSTEPGRV
jgi:hypothetical protein